MQDYNEMTKEELLLLIKEKDAQISKAEADKNFWVNQYTEVNEKFKNLVTMLKTLTSIVDGK